MSTKVNSKKKSHAHTHKTGVAIGGVDAIKKGSTTFVNEKYSP